MLEIHSTIKNGEKMKKVEVYVIYSKQTIFAGLESFCWKRKIDLENYVPLNFPTDSWKKLNPV